VSSEADPRDRPADPAGTQPKVDFESLVPARHDSLLAATASAVDTTAEEDTAPDDGGDLLPERLAHAQTPAPGSGTPEPPHVARFQFLKGGLIAIGLACVAAIVAIAVNGGGGSKDSGPTWSPWRPSADGQAGAQQIADHIGPEYHLSDGEQLVVVTGGGLSLSGAGASGGDLPLSIAIRRTPAEGGKIALIQGKSILYRLCGLGPKCAIPKGKPSQQRHLLLRREALELALYTFRYVDGIDNVVVFMPPRLGQDPSQALFFRKGDVTGELDQPLAATLTRTAPLPNTVLKAPDSTFVDRFTTMHLFQFSLAQANLDNRAFLVLQPFSTTGG
jgi:hypothetical protein